VSKNTDEILGHGAEADGIEEYDNPLPDWWLGMFWIAIIWGIIYAVNFHFIAEDSQAARYDAQMAEAQAMWPDMNKAAEQDNSAEALAAGQEIYTANCVGCHNPELTGGIGPNLVDTEWIHGGTYEDIVRTITDGVPEKGMVTWGPVLGPKKIGQVASFILSKNTGEAPAEPAAAPTPAPAATDGGTEEAAPLPEVPVGDPEAIKRGEVVFVANCLVCHQADLTGGIGPNLVDDEWIHGSEPEDLVRTVVNGVLPKGMPIWRGPLTDEQIADVVAYILSKGE